MVPLPFPETRDKLPVVLCQPLLSSNVCVPHAFPCSVFRSHNSPSRFVSFAFRISRFLCPVEPVDARPAADRGLTTRPGTTRFPSASRVFCLRSSPAVSALPYEPPSTADTEREDLKGPWKPDFSNLPSASPYALFPNFLLKKSGFLSELSFSNDERAHPT